MAGRACCVLPVIAVWTSGAFDSPDAHQLLGVGNQVDGLHDALGYIEDDGCDRRALIGEYDAGLSIDPRDVGTQQIGERFVGDGL